MFLYRQNQDKMTENFSGWVFILDIISSVGYCQSDSTDAPNRQLLRYLPGSSNGSWLAMASWGVDILLWYTDSYSIGNH